MSNFRYTDTLIHGDVLKVKKSTESEWIGFHVQIKPSSQMFVIVGWSCTRFQTPISWFLKKPDTPFRTMVCGSEARILSKQFEKSLANWSESRWNWWPLHIWDLEQKCAPTKGKFIENMARRPLYFANQNTALLEGCSGMCPLGSDCLHRWSLKEVTAFLAFLKLWMRTKKNIELYFTTILVGLCFLVLDLSRMGAKSILKKSVSSRARN